MSDSSRSEDVAALRAQLAATQAELEQLQHRYHVAIIDIGQILRAADRVRANLPDDQLADDAPLFHRDFDPPLLQAIKRRVHRIAQQQVTNAKQLRDNNPNRNPERDLITRYFEEICDETAINGEKRPGKRKLAGLAQRRAKEQGMNSTVSEYAAYQFLRARRLQDEKKTP